jgi:hypothetical protein
MKTTMRAFALFLLAAAVPALAIVMPMRIPFQGKLIDPATNNPKNGAVAMIFKIWNAPTGGVQLFTESQTVNVVNGVFSVQIGTISYLSADMLSGTSAYLGVTAGADAEMVPRQPLSMSPYAYTALQLATDQNIRVNAGITYSTFTTAGNLTLQYGVVGTTASFSVVTATGTGGNASVVASSSIVMSDGYLKIAAASKGIDASGTGIITTTGTFAVVTATGVGTFSIISSSGISMALGSLTLAAASRGIDATGTGVTISTLVLSSMATDPAVSAGTMYYNSSSDSYKMLDASGEWNFIFGQSLRRKSFITTTNTTAIAVSKPAAASILLQPIYLPGPIVVNQMRAFITLALGAAGDIGIYNATGGLVLNGGSSSLTIGTGLKSVAPTQAAAARFLPPGQYYAAITFNSTTGRFGGDTMGAAGIINGVGSIAGGGLVLPASIIPANIVDGTILYLFQLNP